MLAQRQVIDRLTAVGAITKRVGHTADYGEPRAVGSFAKAASERIHLWEKPSCEGGIHHSNRLRAEPISFSKTAPLEETEVYRIEEIRRDHSRGNQRMVLFTRI